MIIDIDIEQIGELHKLTSDYDLFVIINNKQKLLEYQIILNQYRSNVLITELGGDKYICFAWELINYSNKT